MQICPEILHYVIEVGKQVCGTDLLFQGWEFPVYVVNKMWSFKTFTFLCVRHLTPGKE